MTAHTITDLRRELEKTRIALVAAQTHLAAHAEANAALHMAATRATCAETAAARPKVTTICGPER